MGRGRQEHGRGPGVGTPHSTEVTGGAHRGSVSVSFLHFRKLPGGTWSVSRRGGPAHGGRGARWRGRVGAAGSQCPGSAGRTVLGVHTPEATPGNGLSCRPRGRLFTPLIPSFTPQNCREGVISSTPSCPRPRETEAQRAWEGSITMPGSTPAHPETLRHPEGEEAHPAQRPWPLG